MNIKELLGFRKKIDIDEKRIEELKAQLNNLISAFSYNAYKILNEILILRRKQIKGYELSKLSKEKGINMSEGQVRYVFGYKYATKKSMKLVEDVKIQPSLLLYLIRRGKVFRKPKKQDKVINAILTKKIKIPQISNISPSKIMRRLESKNDNLGNDEFMIRMLQKLSRIKKELEEGKKMFNDKRMKDRLWKIINEIRFIVSKL